LNDRPLLPGRVYTFLYPSINFECLLQFTPLKERRCLVTQIRDTTVDSLNEETLVTHPYRRRGRFLITGLDLDKFEQRSFYVASMAAVRELDTENSIPALPTANGVSLSNCKLPVGIQIPGDSLNDFAGREKRVER
jgi:hypothetical protein